MDVAHQVPVFHIVRNCLSAAISSILFYSFSFAAAAFAAAAAFCFVHGTLVTKETNSLGLL